MGKTFEYLADRNAEDKYLCVGFDPKREHVAKTLKAHLASIDGQSLLEYSKGIANATLPFAACYKAQFACWARYPSALRELFRHVRSVHPGIPLILDGKFGDIARTCRDWAEFAQWIGADAVTANPYMGMDDVMPEFLKADVDVIFLASTSNEKARHLQSRVGEDRLRNDVFIARELNERVTEGQPLGIVVGATRPEDLARIAHEAPMTPFLIPGIGTQGGDLELTVRAMRDHQAPWTINVSSGIAEADKDPESWQAFTGSAREEAARYDENIRRFIKA